MQLTLVRTRRRNNQHFLMLSAYAVLLSLAVSSSAADADVSKGEAKNWHLLEPMWASPVVYLESMLFVKEGNAAPKARLALTPKHIKRVALANGSQVFTPDDYTVDATTQTIKLTATSRIPHLNAVEMFPAKGSPRSIRGKAGHPTQHVLYQEGRWFHDQQVEVTYETDEAWEGYRPIVAKDALPRTLRKLKEGKPLTVALSGDSITVGDNASAVAEAPPSMPAYPRLVAEQLHVTFGSKITLVNRAVGGWRLEHGLKDLPKLLEAKPDLVIIAYGMNNVRLRDPAGFQRIAAQMIEKIRKADNETEIILVSSMYGNRDWDSKPPEQFPLHRDALASLVSPGTALCDVTSIWGKLLERKRFVDLTGNGVNHPNDFGHRLYAQAILGLMVDVPQTAEK
jgi:acyl-CoA thioesterase I